jgi:hypothetical protein
VKGINFLGMTAQPNPKSQQYIALPCFVTPYLIFAQFQQQEAFVTHRQHTT